MVLEMIVPNREWKWKYLKVQWALGDDHQLTLVEHFQQVLNLKRNFILKTDELESCNNFKDPQV